MKVSINKLEFTVDPCHFKETWELIGSGNWESDTINTITNFSDENKTFLDLGAWAGPITLFAASLSKRVIAFEPDPVVYEQLKNNVSLNPSLSEKITCLEMAVSKSTGLSNLYAREAFGNSSSSIMNRARDQKSISNIKTITLQEFVLNEKVENIGFIKVDIESAEYDLFSSIPPTFWVGINNPTICVSFHPSQLREHLVFKRFKSKFLSKVFLKVSQYLAFLDFTEKEILQRTRKSFESLKNYQYVYTTEGVMVSAEQLNSPEIISKKNLVFTNRQWHLKK